MPESKISLYFKNVSAEVIGAEHGIMDEQFKELAKKTLPAIAECNKQRQAGKIPYRDLPYNEDYPKAVKAVAE
ncbi:MAG: hypothetical protein KAG97_08905, partial [Victivallales bacterium]|nr:hypothetical protein [Victivallales bacterium]